MIAKTLKSQLTLITLLPMLITLLFISVLVLQEFDSNLEEEIDSRAFDISTQASMLSEFYIYTGDVSGLNQVSQTLMRIDGLAYIKFINNSGQLLMQQGSDKKGKVHHYSFPIYSSQVQVDDLNQSSSNTFLGTVELGLSTQSTFNKRYQVYQRLLLISLTSLLLGVLLILFFGKALKSSINNLTSAAKAIQKGNFDTRCAESGTGELLEFQKIFNTMAAAFEQSEQKLKAKVDAATASLHLTIDELSHKNEELAASRQETIILERSKAISDERERIMQDMHDGIGGQLVASLALLEQEKDSDLKENVRQILSDCLNDLRLIINSLNMANNGLSALLADLKYRMNKKLEQMNIKLFWSIDEIADEVHMPPQMSLHLLRILQEAFTNILKHAQASEIHFELTHQQQAIQIRITDNGHFDPEQLNSNGIGLTNMRSRARFMEANLEISRAKGGGCTVELTLPLAKYHQQAKAPTIEG